MIETIIFDLGRVILDFDHHLITRRLSQISGYDEAELFDLIFTPLEVPASGDLLLTERAISLEKSFDEGKASPEDFFKELIRELNVSIDFQEFKILWNDIFFPPKDEMVNLLNELKKNYRLYLLSNTNKLHFEYVREKYEILGIFEEYILSYRLGIRKPDPRIYLEALKRSNSSPDRCIYTDDIKEFAEGATRVGMKGVHFTSVEELVQRLKEYGVS